MFAFLDFGTRKPFHIFQNFTKFTNKVTNISPSSTMSDSNVIDVYLPTYRLEPEENERFYPSRAKEVAEKIMLEELKDKKGYDQAEAKRWSLSISNHVRHAITEQLQNTRYKIVVQTIIGKMNNQGFRFASRSLWNASTDNYASVSFSNQELFCTVFIAATYTD